MLNKVQLAGRITDDAKASQTENGKIYMRYNLAVQKNLSKKQKEKMEKTANFIPCVVWSESSIKYALANFEKGDTIIVDGELIANDYINSKGERIFGLNVKVNSHWKVSSPKNKK